MTGYHEKFLKLIDNKIQTYKLIFMSGKGDPEEAKYHKGYIDGLNDAKDIFKDSNK